MRVQHSSKLEKRVCYCYSLNSRILGRAEQLVCVCNKDGIVCTYDIGLQ